MDNVRYCMVMLLSLHSTWTASIPVDRVVTNGVIQPISIRRHYADTDVASVLQGIQVSSILPSIRISGPRGRQQIDAGGLIPKQIPLTKDSPKSASSPSVRQATVNSAFMVYKTSTQVGNMSDILTFDSVTSNEGNNFDISTGIFTCSTPGMYTFAFTIITEDYPIMNLVKNQEVMATVFRSYDGAGLYDTISNQAVMQLQTGDQVFMMFMGYDEQSVYGDPYYKYTTFSGYLLF